MSMLSKEINRYVSTMLSGAAEIVHADAAESFIQSHEDVLDQHVTEMIARYIRAEIKAQSQAPSGPVGQGVLFEGLPAAITVRDGVTKPLPICNRVDLEAGREVKVVNIERANGALVAYDRDLEQLRPAMTTDATTVEEAAIALRENGAA